jgi:hypothetical protein
VQSGKAADEVQGARPNGGRDVRNDEEDSHDGGWLTARRSRAGEFLLSLIFGGACTLT